MSVDPKDRLLRMFDHASELWNQQRYEEAFEEYERCFPLLVVQTGRSHRSKSLGSMAGWTAGFLSGGLGLEDLVLIPLVSRGVSGLLGVDDGFINQMVGAIVLRQLDCLLMDDGLCRETSWESVFQKFAMLWATRKEASTMERVLRLYVPEFSTGSVFDEPEVSVAAYAFLLDEVSCTGFDVDGFDLLLYRYLGKVGDRSELYFLLEKRFSEFREEQADSSGTNGRTSQEQRTGRQSQATPSSKKELLAILGLRPNATKQEAHEAYRLLMKMYHPDRFAALSAEFQELAEQKSKTINAAYARLMEILA